MSLRTIRNNTLFFLLAISLLASPALGANRIKTWSDGNTLTAAELNAEYDNVYTGTIQRSAGNWGSNDDIPVCFGTSGCNSDSRIEWDAAGQGQDALVIFTGGANHVIIADVDDAGTDYGRSAATDPTLFIQSADATSTTDFISLAHNQTNGVVDVGSGDLDFQFAGVSKVWIDDASGNIAVEGSTDDEFESAISFTDPTADRTLTIPDGSVTLQTGTALVGPGAVTDNTIPAFDGTGGNTLQPTGVAVDDSDNVTGIANLTTTGTTTLNAVAYTWPAADSTGSQQLTSNGSGTLSWATPTGAGDVSGPGGGSTDNALVRWNGAGGDTVQDSSILIDDSNNMSAVANFSNTGSSTLGNAATDDIVLTGEITGATPLRFTGATADTVETIIAVTDPTSSDKTITLPNATGTVITDGNTSDLTTNETNNRVLTSIGADSGQNAEANLTFTGSTLAVTGSLTTSVNTTLGNAAADVITMTGTIAGASPLVFEGSTANDFETTFAIADPTTPDKTITFKNETGTVALLTDITGGDTVGDVTQASQTPTDTTTGTDIQLVNVSNSGYLDSVVCTVENADTDVAFSGENCNIKINIDGGGEQTLADIAVGGLFSADDVYNGFDTSSNDSFSGRRIFLHARFETSLTVDIYQDSGGTLELGGAVHYTLDQ